jgi:hypothetical protein
MRVAHGVKIDFELQSMILKGKTQGPARAEKIWGLTNCKDIGALNQLQYLRVAFGLGTADEQNVALAMSRILMNPSNFCSILCGEELLVSSVRDVPH